MRELLYKNLTSNDHKKRDVLLLETVEKDGILATNERRCLYFIRDKIEIKNPADLVKLAAIRHESQNAKRHIHILKCHNSDRDTDKLICKIEGTFYAVAGNVVYCIVFIQTFKIRFKVVATEEENT